MLGIDAAEVSSHRAPWNKGRLIGQKRPLKPKEVWAIRVRLQLEERRRDLAQFNLALDSKLRGCDLVRLQVNDVCGSVGASFARVPRASSYLAPSGCCNSLAGSRSRAASMAPGREDLKS